MENRLKLLGQSIYNLGPNTVMEWMEGIFLRCFFKALKNDDLEKANEFLHAIIYLGPEVDNVEEAVKELNSFWDDIVGKKIKNEYVLKKDGDIFKIAKKEGE